jgi:hypothetical protein
MLFAKRLSNILKLIILYIHHKKNQYHQHRRRTQKKNTKEFCWFQIIFNYEIQANPYGRSRLGFTQQKNFDVPTVLHNIVLNHKKNL